jgi:hypothetical protein
LLIGPFIGIGTVAKENSAPNSLEEISTVRKTRIGVQDGVRRRELNAQICIVHLTDGQIDHSVRRDQDQMPVPATVGVVAANLCDPVRKAESLEQNPKGFLTGYFIRSDRGLEPAPGACSLRDTKPCLRQMLIESLDQTTSEERLAAVAHHNRASGSILRPKVAHFLTATESQIAPARLAYVGGSGRTDGLPLLHEN